MPIVSNQPGVVALSQSGGRPAAGIGPSPTPTRPLAQPPPGREAVSAETDAERTPGTAAAASRRRSTRAPRSSGGPPLAWRFNSTTSSGSGTKPSGNWLSDANVRRNSPAATTRTSDTAICATTSVPRTAKRRSPAIPRPASLSASPGRHALQPEHGRHAAAIAERHARAAVNAEHAPVEREVQRHGALPRAQLLHEQRAAPLREHQPERGTGHGHDQTLDEEQPREPPARARPAPGAR